MLAMMIILHLIIASVASPILMKKLALKPSITKRLAFQFIVCAVIALIICAIYQEIRLVWAIVLLGIANALGAYFQWKSTRLSISKTAVFGFNDVIAILLGATVLREYQQITPLFLFAVVLAGVAVYLLFQGSKISKGQAGYIIGFSLIWGVAAVIMKAYPIAVPQFLVNWYVGSTIGALILTFCLQEEKEVLGLRDYVGTAILSVLIFLALGLQIVSYKMGTLMMIQTIYFVGATVLPLIVGIVFLKERVANSKEKLAIVLAVIACLLIAFTKIH